MPDSRDTRVSVTVAEAARMLGIPKPTGYAWARDGHLPTVRIGRKLLVPLKSLNDLLTKACAPTCACVCHGVRPV